MKLKDIATIAVLGVIGFALGMGVGMITGMFGRAFHVRLGGIRGLLRRSRFTPSWRARCKKEGRLSASG